MRIWTARLLALALTLSAGAAAAEPARVAVVRPEGADAIVHEATTRLQAELAAAGFEVVLVDEPPGLDPRPFPTVAIVLTERGAAADVWVLDHVTHRTLVRHVDADATGEVHVPTALAIRAVDFVRASLVEGGAATERPLPAPPPAPAPWTASPSELAPGAAVVRIARSSSA